MNPPEPVSKYCPNSERMVLLRSVSIFNSDDGDIAAPRLLLNLGWRVEGINGIAASLAQLYQRKSYLILSVAL